MAKKKRTLTWRIGDVLHNLALVIIIALTVIGAIAVFLYANYWVVDFILHLDYHLTGNYWVAGAGIVFLILFDLWVIGHVLKALS